MKETVKHFDPLTREEILSLQPGRWDDYDLLDALGHFEEEDDEDRATAVEELILRSPEHSGMVLYSDLYRELVNYYRWEDDYPAALRWAHALIAYEEQHEPGQNRGGNLLTLAETYLDADDLDAGLALIARRLHAVPGDIWVYNRMGFALPRLDLNILAAEMLERALALVADADPAGLQDQLQDQYDMATAGDEDGDRLDEIDPEILADLRAALALPATTVNESSEPEPYLPPLDDLLEADTRAEALDAEILAQAKVLAPDLIRMAFDEELRDTPAPDHAVALLRKMRDDDAVALDALSDWLDKAEGEWQRELLTEQMGKIGGYTTAELEDMLLDDDYAVYVRTSASAALVERAEKCPEQREQIVEIIRGALTRPGADASADEELLTGFAIAHSLDLDAPELYPEIKQAFDEDRVDTSFVTLPEVQAEWDVETEPRPERRSDGMYLRLRCTECGREREHFVQNVVVDLNTLERQREDKPVKYSPYIMDREIVCPKCGAADRYKASGQASMQLLGPPDAETMLNMLTGQEPDPSQIKLNPRVYYVRPSIFGRAMHPLEGLRRYQRMIAQNPNRAEWHVRRANLLRTLFRFDAALESYRRAYELDSEDVDIVLSRAMAEHDFGDPDVAKQLYKEARPLVQQVKDWQEQLDLNGLVAQGLKALKRGESSPWTAPYANRRGEPQSLPYERDRKKKRR